MSFADSSFAVALLRRMDALIKADKDFDMTKPEDRRQMTENRPPSSVLRLRTAGLEFSRKTRGN
jgi:hypothetical protein